jgi:hypothetical protein
MTATTKATKAEAVINTNLVTAYLEVAESRQTGAYWFVRQTEGISVATIKASIKEAKDQCEITLPDLTPTKAQHFATLLALDNRFADLESSVPFARVYKIAEKADRAFGADEARAKIAKAKDLDTFEASLPANVRKARPASEKSAKAEAEYKGEVVEKSVDDLLAMIATYAEKASTEERAHLVEGLTATALLIKSMGEVKAKRTRKAKVTA